MCKCCIYQTPAMTDLAPTASLSPGLNPGGARLCNRYKQRGGVYWHTGRGPRISTGLHNLSRYWSIERGCRVLSTRVTSMLSAHKKTSEKQRLRWSCAPTTGVLASPDSMQSSRNQLLRFSVRGLASSMLLTSCAELHVMVTRPARIAACGSSAPGRPPDHGWHDS